MIRPRRPPVRANVPMRGADRRAAQGAVPAVRRRVLFGLAGLAAAGIVWAAPPSAPGAALTLLPTGTFGIVPGESSATFFVPDNRGGFMGRTTRVTGRVTVEPGPGGETYSAAITASIDAGSITTGIGIRDAAMRTIYLRTAEFPTITYAGTAAARPGLGVRPFPTTLRGRLTIRRVTRDEDFTATVVALASEYVADASATVRMADYGIPYPRAFVFVARDPVTVKLHVVARQP